MKLLSKKAVREKVLYSPAHIARLEAAGLFPKAQVVPGLVTWDFVEEVRAKYGEDSDIYRVRVLGEFPQRASDTLISIDAIEKAFGADRELINQEDECIGLDPARFGDDDSAFVYRKGNTARVRTQ